MDDTALVIWDPALVGYDFGEGHPMNPLRLALTAKLAEGLGVLEHVRIEAPSLPDGSDAFLETVHSREYLDAVRAASQNPASADENFGIGTEDDPAFAGMHDASALIAAASVEACRAEGAEVVAVATVVDRATGAAEVLREAGLEYRYLLGLEDLGLS